MATSRAWYRGARLLLERRFVLFVDHDQAQVGRRGENRAAGADDHLHLALGDLLPVPMPLGVGQMAVQHRHAAEAARNRSTVCGVRLISGTSTIACRPKRITSSIAWM